MRTIAVVTVLLALFATTVFAETIEVENGEIYEGIVESEDDGWVYMTLTSGGKIDIRKTDIVKRLKDGEDLGPGPDESGIDKALAEAKRKEAEDRRKAEEEEKKRAADMANRPTVNVPTPVDPGNESTTDPDPETGEGTEDDPDPEDETVSPDTTDRTGQLSGSKQTALEVQNVMTRIFNTIIYSLGLLIIQSGLFLLFCIVIKIRNLSVGRCLFLAMVCAVSFGLLCFIRLQFGAQIGGNLGNVISGTKFSEVVFVNFILANVVALLASARTLRANIYEVMFFGLFLFAETVAGLFGIDYLITVGLIN